MENPHMNFSGCDAVFELVAAIHPTIPPRSCPTCRTQRRLQQRQGRVAGRSFRHGGVAKKIADETKMNNSKNKMDDKQISDRYLVLIIHPSSSYIHLDNFSDRYMVQIWDR